MKVSVFTPSHDARYLDDAYESLIRQTERNWEWVIVLNKGAQWELAIPDERVRIVHAPPYETGIGALKKSACHICSGDVLLELDHDDMLWPTCIEEVLLAFQTHPNVGFVYSDTVRFKDDGSRSMHFSAAYGWEEQRRVEMGRLVGWTQPSFDVTPQSLARIWYAPDHVRAWRRETYAELDGHNSDYEVCDDYELLLRTYLHTEMHHIREPLYWYRVREDSTSAASANSRIQEIQFALGNEYRVRIAETWARRKGLALIDLCSGPKPADGYIGLDKYHGVMASNEEYPGLPGQVFLAHLDQRWRIYDNEVGVLRAQDALEHLPDKLHTLQEAHRVLAHGGWFFIDTPSTDGRGAWQDPTHVSYWNSNSFWYYTSERHRRFVPEAPHFQMWHLDNVFYDDWYRLHNIPYVRAHMSAIKDGPRLAGPYDFTI